MLRTTVAVIALSLGGAVAASAQPALEGVLSTLTRQGFGGFEIKREDGQVKVEAQRGTTERELVYDAATGRLLKDETGRSVGRVARDDDGPGQDLDDDRRGRARDDRGAVGRVARNDDGPGHDLDDDRRGRAHDDRGGDDRSNGGRSRHSALHDRNDDHGGRSGRGGGSGREASGRGGSGRGGHDDGPDDHRG